MTPPLVILGCGFTGTTLARLALAAGRPVRATTREPSRAESLRALGITAYAFDRLDATAVRSVIPDGADVITCFPPDELADEAVTATLGRVRASAYVSSTAVYGSARGRVNESTPLDLSEPRAAARFRAESLYRQNGSVVIRAAGIYGPGRGLHVRVARGEFKLPADGTNVVSRIHVHDLASALLAAVERGRPGMTYVLADDAPVPQREAVAWLCDRLGVPFPPSLPLDKVAETLRHDRAVDNARIKSELALTLRYPTYREGFAACLTDDGLAPR